ncbi:MAG TPA: hypothetical protein PLO14_03200 [Accumulibacter sp.]|uniref:hypothetical protein n=1 Tax=Accumulibacter sp. TaxID=2053492 RepID=UPI0025E8E8BA|nr:hypothetical protein [Accumulibacter sp.]MCM8599925.1 hypothetical protein [Accumulibacter sp.]MCM8664109.1 hypothetical protein [Accumulibacter sp.]HNC51235.1 hypothetical protein [Accumulibacter sp.]
MNTTQFLFADLKRRVELFEAEMSMPNRRNADLLAESIVLSAEHLHAQVRIDFAGLERKTH